ncbi:MAG TPA: LTA synthase family protein, partial [Beijerinckiaceae bacterium]|nr:LTA synthase family protein [Beijerinckiaceae bacterium]
MDSLPRKRRSLVLLVALHLTALVILLLTETALVPKLAFLVSWLFFNFGWMVLLRRPAMAAALALFFLCLLIVLSKLKHEILLMTVNFVDILLIDPDTFAFLMQVFPGLGLRSAGAALLIIGALAIVWRNDVLR